MATRNLSALRRTLALCLLLVLVSPFCGCGGGSRPGRSTPPDRGVSAHLAQAPEPVAPPPRFFAPDSVWNARLPTKTHTDPRSPVLTAALLSVVEEEIAGKRGPWISTTGFSTPLYTVPATEPLVRVHLANSDPALQRAFDAVPLPAQARPAAGSDSQLTVWQPSSDRLWEFWRLARSGEAWQARWGGAMQHVSSNPGVFTSAAWPGANRHWGSTSTSLPLLGGLITLEDLRRGHVEHALALGFPMIERGVARWPAQRTDGAAEGPLAIPAGTRFRLDPRLRLTELNLPPLVRMLAQAAQRYGIVVRDTSGVVDFYGEDPTPTGSNPYLALFGEERPWQQLARFPWKHLKVIG